MPACWYPRPRSLNVIAQLSPPLHWVSFCRALYLLCYLPRHKATFYFHLLGTQIRRTGAMGDGGVARARTLEFARQTQEFLTSSLESVGSAYLGSWTLEGGVKEAAGVMSSSKGLPLASTSRLFICHSMFLLEHSPNIWMVILILQQLELDSLPERPFIFSRLLPN